MMKKQCSQIDKQRNDNSIKPKLGKTKSRVAKVSLKFRDCYFPSVNQETVLVILGLWNHLKTSKHMYWTQPIQL